MRTSPRLAPLGLALLLSACLPDEPLPPDAGTEPPGGADAGPRPAPADAGPLPAPADAGPLASDEVRITHNVPYVTTAEQWVAEPVATPAEVLLPTASGYTRLSGAETLPGLVSVRGVPAGARYLVRSGRDYVYTSARSVNRGWARAERPGVPAADGGATTAQLTLSGLSPWNGSGGYDTLQLVALEAGGSAQLQPNPSPAVGSTSLDAAPADFYTLSGAYLPRLDPRTDTLVLVQQVAQDVGTPTEHLAVRRGAQLTAPAFDGSAPLQLDAALRELPQRSVFVDLRATAFCASRAQVHPDATLNSMQLTVLPAAYGLSTYGWVGYSGELLLLNAASGADFARSFSYGNPFPASWGEVGGADCLFQHRMTLPSGRSGSVYGSVGVSDALQRLVAGPVVPALLPPQNLRVDGAPATAAQRLASLTPTVSWDPPAQGLPTSYRLTVYRMNDTGTAVPRSIVAMLELPPDVRSLRLPEGILASGAHYALRLTAHLAPGWDITREETAQLLPHHSADALSGLLSAP